MNKKITFEYEPSLKAELVFKFIPFLLDHIKYTIKQYSDMDSDEVSKWTPEQIMSNVNRYCRRFGKNSRPGQEKLDILKSIDYLIRLYFLDIEVTKTDERILLEKIKDNCYNVDENIINEIQNLLKENE